MPTATFHCPALLTLAADPPSDGLVAWREVFDSIQRHMAGQQTILAIVGAVLLVLLVLAADYLLARWIDRSTSHRRPSDAHPEGRSHGDHQAAHHPTHHHGDSHGGRGDRAA